MSETSTVAPPLLSIRNLKKHYPVRGGVFSTVKTFVRAVDGVSFDVKEGETLGLVGESGCGKSTLGRNIMRLEEPTEGSVFFGKDDIASADSRTLFNLRRELQMIFQDPYSSLNPRMTIGEIIREPLMVHRMGTRQEQTDRVIELMELVGLNRELVDRYPHEFSGGQRQRIGIARALTLDPKVIIADEPVSALDVSVQAQVINLMVRLQRELNLTYIFISHDLSVVEYISDTIAIMYLGRIVEKGPKEKIFSKPAHPYTRALMDAIPVPDPTRKGKHVPIEGETPSPLNPPSGCPFHPRCKYAVEDCKMKVPQLEAMAEGDDSHLASCIRKHEI